MGTSLGRSTPIRWGKRGRSSGDEHADDKDFLPVYSPCPRSRTGVSCSIGAVPAGLMGLVRAAGAVLSECRRFIPAGVVGERNNGNADGTVEF